MKIRVMVMLMALGQTLTGCEEPISFDTPEDHFLVVDGLISDLPGSTEIRLTTSFRYTEPVQNNAVNNAEIRIIDSNGGSFPLRNTNNAGFYIPESTAFAAIPGTAYHIEVIHLGKSYHSIPEVMHSPRSYTLDSRVEHITVLMDNRIPIKQKVVAFYAHISNESVAESNTSPYLKWNWSGYFPGAPVITEAPTEYVKIFDLSNLDTIPPLQVGYRRDNFTEQKEFILSTTQYTISKEAFDYWNLIKKQLENTGSIFDSFPSTIKGNVYPQDGHSPVAGYVMVAATSKKQLNILFN